MSGGTTNWNHCFSHVLSSDKPPPPTQLNSGPGAIKMKLVSSNDNARSFKD